jgi:phosphotriesterase-related protein
MGSGHYRAPSHPPWLAGAAPEDVASEIVADLITGVNGVRAGVIGEIGTSAPVSDAEAIVLAGAARAQSTTGRALFIHVDPWAGSPGELLAICEGGYADPARTVLCHMDARLPPAKPHRELAKRGVWVSYDLFGDDRDWYGGRRFSSDDARVDAVIRAFDEGWAGQLVLAHDVALKTRLKRYGGSGYDHLAVRIVPRLKARHLTDADIYGLFVENPRRLLAHAPD